ncbi:uncharacterized protein MONOS_13115 [Monocercomonoides exilis]|uniref:uncharacterized protein n=1 Tax=Monocercomonoides exilis TaxID=2049356 RepID=UPI00355A4C70|nr:hypothetical protein MONOS_13115 [Monocercomonoides exilis]|eukprot:MONOS_13115.1-p1 / transcript=MONOS_13115.1 / gene=MONOS_13115 / organism=Monocercomonoides_exilis_PA203 / gene_product=unspecified product / transcript_product=unspecified product / location=Mono_scaffold00779:21212-22211(-) / protein_length=296 / sequence_SO=supercontig / SO=protein_coding / is_pseudo=false
MMNQQAQNALNAQPAVQQGEGAFADRIVGKGSGCWQLSFILLLLGVLFTVGTVLITVLLGVAFLGVFLAFAIVSLVFGLVLMCQDKQAVLVADFREQVLRIEQRRTCLHSCCCCCCGVRKMRQQQLRFEEMCGVFACPVCCSMGLRVVKKSGVFVSVMSTFSADDVERLSGAVNDFIARTRPGDVQVAAQFHQMDLLMRRGNRGGVNYGSRRALRSAMFPNQAPGYAPGYAQGYAPGYAPGYTTGGAVVQNVSAAYPAEPAANIAYSPPAMPEAGELGKEAPAQPTSNDPPLALP